MTRVDSEVSEAVLRSIPGNASIEVKGVVKRWFTVLTAYGFGTRSGQCLGLVEVSVIPNADEPTKRETKVVLETTVTKDMVNAFGTVHGACIAHFVDICTTLPITGMSVAQGGTGSPGVSQSINIIYHAPARLGDQLRLVTTSTIVGSRVWSARIQIWDMTHHQLVASATQLKMESSGSKL